MSEHKPTIRYQQIDNPGALSTHKKAQLSAQVIALYRAVSSLPMSVEYWEQRVCFCDEVDGMTLAWSGDRLVGCIAQKRWNRDGAPVLYIDSMGVAQDHQKYAIGSHIAFRAFVRFMIRTRFQQSYVVARTPNPQIVHALTDAFGSDQIFPSASSRPVLRSISASVAASLSPELRYDPDIGVIEGAYGGPLVPRTRPPRSAWVADYFARHVSRTRGDAVVLTLSMGPLSLLKIGWALARRIARRWSAAQGLRPRPSSAT